MTTFDGDTTSSFDTPGAWPPPPPARESELGRAWWDMFGGVLGEAGIAGEAGEATDEECRLMGRDRPGQPKRPAPPEPSRPDPLGESIRLASRHEAGPATANAELRSSIGAREARRTESSPPAPAWRPQAIAGAAAPGVTTPGDGIAEASGGVGVLRFADGTVIAVGGTIVLGRNPTATTDRPGDAAGTERLVRVPDPDRVLSRVHLVVRTRGGLVEVIDPGSVNRTEVLASGQPPVLLVSGEPVTLPVGATLRMADSIEIRYDRG